MAEPPARRADHLVNVLEVLARQLAAHTPRQPSDAATPEQIDLVIALREVARTLVEFAEGVPQQPPPSDTWAWLADVLDSAAWLCRQQVVIDVVDDRGPG